MMAERKLCCDGIRERELEACRVAARVHSDGQYVTVTMDRWTFDFIRRQLTKAYALAPTSGAEILPMREMQVTLFVE
jgi:hypothetical protein